MNRISEVAYRLIDMLLRAEYTMIQFWKAYFDAEQRVYCHLNRACFLYKTVCREEIRDDEWWRKDVKQTRQNVRYTLHCEKWDLQLPSSHTWVQIAFFSYSHLIYLCECVQPALNVIQIRVATIRFFISHRPDLDDGYLFSPISQLKSLQFHCNLVPTPIYGGLFMVELIFG